MSEVTFQTVRLPWFVKEIERDLTDCQDHRRNPREVEEEAAPPAD